MLRQWVGGCGVVVVAVAGLVAEAVAADPVDVVRTYRFIPRVSTVVQTGGIAGIHLKHTVVGKFDLNLGPEVSIPELEIHPSFENVDSWLIPHSPLLYVLNTDEVLNLSGLEGSYVTPRRILFRGVDGQGAPFRLQVTLHRRLLHMVGATNPGCCDFFQYHVNAYAHLAPYADFNFDGVVDAADYTVWRNNLGNAANATLEQGDADGDGDVDSDDYSVWRRDSGTAVDMNVFADDLAVFAAEGGGSLTAGAAPEPTAVALGLLSFVPFVCWRRPRR